MSLPDHKETALLARLETLGIAVEMYRHPPLHTVAESQALRGAMPGAHIKNLFLRDKKRTKWLVTVPEDAAIDLKALRHILGARGNLSFGDAAMLRQHLDVEPGSVTPFAVMNDDSGAVIMVLARELLAHDIINAHPLHNAATAAISSHDLLRFLEDCGHKPRIVDLPAGGPEQNSSPPGVDDGD